MFFLLCTIRCYTLQLCKQHTMKNTLQSLLSLLLCLRQRWPEHPAIDAETTEGKGSEPHSIERHEWNGMERVCSAAPTSASSIHKPQPAARYWYDGAD